MTVASACAELAQLAPMLGPALRRDTTNPGGFTRWEATIAPVNTDVLSVMITLRHEIPATTTWAAAAIGEKPQSRTLHACLLTLPRLDHHLVNLNLLTHHTRLEQATRSWVRTTKTALGLRKPDLVLPASCPTGDCQPPGTLRMTGAEGTIRHTPDGPRVEWSNDYRIWCPACGATWAQSEWDLLIRVLTQQVTA